MANAEAGNAGKLLVWPWTGILAMATSDPNAASTLTVHADQLFTGITTTTLQEDAASHHLHFLVIHFGKSWSGLWDAMSLEFHFARAGRREWQRLSEGDNSGSMFGWVATQEDLLSDGAIGRFLREAGVRARTVEDIEKDEASVTTGFYAVIGEYERRAKFLEAKCEEMVLLVNRVEEESSLINDELKEFRKLWDNVIPEMNRGIHENEKFRAQLDAVGREIESRMERIQELKDGRTKLRCSKVQKLVFEINSLDMAGREPKTSDMLERFMKNIRVIGIKMMGQLDEKPFHHACKRKFRDDDPVGKAVRLVSNWQEELKKTSWRPFTTILVDGEDKDVVDEDDPKLKELQAEYGDNVCNAVKVALAELNEYNPRGRDVVNELWNFNEARRATMPEVLKYIFEQLKTSS